ncbi:MAG: dipeptidase [Bacteroidales bacterium]
MSRFIPVFIVLLFCSAGDIKYDTKANAIHEDVFTIDTHNDTPMLLGKVDFDIGKHNSFADNRTRVDFPRMKIGGLDAAFFAIFVGQRERTTEGYQKALSYAEDRIFRLKEAVKQNAHLAAIAMEPDDGIKLEKKGKRAVYLGLENGYPIGKDIGLIKKFHDEGIRYITLCHTKNNDICDSSNDEAEYNGLSSFGKKVIREMNKLGIIIDVSHASDNTFRDVIRLTKAPVIASHSCARTICDNPRNLSDDLLRKLAKNNGAIQICLLSDYVKTPAPYPERDSAKQAVYKKHGDYYSLDEEGKARFLKDWYAVDEVFPQNLATVSDLVDHIDHVVKIAGIDHVGIGSDFDGGGGLADLRDVSEFPKITEELLARGYSHDEIRKIWGGNFMRVFKEVRESKSLDLTKK